MHDLLLSFPSCYSKHISEKAVSFCDIYKLWIQLKFSAEENLLHLDIS